MGTKTANVMARVEPDIKEQAEQILDQLGLPVSTVINAMYRQIIMCKGIPFSLTVEHGLKSRDAMNKGEFDESMRIGLEQAKADDSIPIDEAFARLRKGIRQNG